ncbi:Uncharacterised protein [Shewanella baltica]|nr:Uncharacterised protein [Shewanella baltica]
MNRSEDFGKILKLWPNLVDHYSIPSVFELRHGPLLVIPQATAAWILTPRLSKFCTLVRGFRHCSGIVNLAT